MTVYAQPDTYQTCAVVIRQIFITDGYQTPECLFGRHVHKKHGSYRRHRLAVAVHRVVHRVGFQHTEQILLPRRQAN